MQAWQPQIKGVGEIQTLSQRREVGWQRLNISPVFPQVQCGFRTEIAYCTPGLSNGLWVELRDGGYKECGSPLHPPSTPGPFGLIIWAVHLEVQPFHFFHFSFIPFFLSSFLPPSFLPFLTLLWKRILNEVVLGVCLKNSESRNRHKGKATVWVRCQEVPRTGRFRETESSRG